MTYAFDRVAAAKTAITIAPGAHDIEALQCETGWVDIAVANSATLLVAVLVQLLADGRGAADIGIQRGHIWRRRQRWLADQPRHNPGATFHGGGRRAVGSDFQDAGFGEQAAADAARGQSNGSQL